MGARWQCSWRGHRWWTYHAKRPGYWLVIRACERCHKIETWRMEMEGGAETR